MTGSIPFGQVSVHTVSIGGSVRWVLLVSAFHCECSLCQRPLGWRCLLRYNLRFRRIPVPDVLYPAGHFLSPVLCIGVYLHIGSFLSWPFLCSPTSRPPSLRPTVRTKNNAVHASILQHLLVSECFLVVVDDVSTGRSARRCSFVDRVN